MTATKGYWRLDMLILFSYQMCHFFGIQQIFPIFLHYTPKIACRDNVCFQVPKSKCMVCPDCPNLCGNFTAGPDYDACVQGYQSGTYYNSAAMDYDIFCKPGWKDFRPAFAQYVGVLIGNIILGWVADKIGRRLTFLISLGFGIPALFLSGWFDSIVMFYFLRAVTGIAIAGTMVVGWAYFSELVSPHNRFKLRTFSNWANARIMLTTVAYFSGDWRISSYLSAGISLLTFAIVMFVLPESHIWLRKQGRYEEAEKSRKRVAWLAGVEYEPLPPPEKSEFAEPEKKETIITVFKDPSLRTNLLVLWMMWFVTGMTAYLTDLAGGDMTKNFWVGQYLSGILLSAVRIILGFADGHLPWMGRRFVLLCSQSLAVFFFGFVVFFLIIGEKGEWYYTAVYLAAFVFTSIVWEPCYLCASELMPTDVRATSTASCSIVGRIANIGASMLTNLKTIYEPGIHMISMGLGVANILVACAWLEETKNVSLDKVGKKKDEAKDGTINGQEMVNLLPENGKDEAKTETVDEK